MSVFHVLRGEAKVGIKSNRLPLFLVRFLLVLFEMELPQQAIKDLALTIAFETDAFHSAKDRRHMTFSIIGFWQVPAH